MTSFELKDQKGSKLAILQTLRLHGSMSRIELSRLTGLSRATISISIAELMEYGLVCETHHRQTTKGRPATSLELAPNSRVMIGADLDNHTWTIGAFDLLGHVVKTRNIPVHTLEPETSFKILAKEIHALVKELELPVIPLLGLGVPGLVDAEHSVIRSAAESGWHNVDVGGLMKEETGWTTVVINRHRARGLAECRYADLQYHNMIYIGVGSGIAAGLYMNRQLLSGAMGGAGEIGHTTVEPNGPLCPCGNRGCLQALSAGPAIEQEYRKLVRLSDRTTAISDQLADLQLVKAQDICAAAENGESLAIEMVQQAADYLGIVMANLLNTFNPEAIILGGFIPNASPLFVDIATRTMRQRAMHPLSRETVVKTSTFKEIGGALGAANFALDKHIRFLF